MENLMKQMRVKFTGAEQENKADQGGSKDQKIPIQKTQSFTEKVKGQPWFPRQFLRKMSRDYDSLEVEHATAVAAAAFAIKSQEFPEQKMNEAPESSLSKTNSRVGGIKYPRSQPGGESKRFSGSFKSTDGQVNKVPIFPVTDEKKPEKAVTPVLSIRRTSSEHFNTDDKKPEASAPRKTPTFGKNTDDTKPVIPKRTPTFGDENLKNIDDTKPGTTAPKLAPPVHSASSRPTPPPPPPAQFWDSSIKPGPVRPPTPPIDTKRQTSTRPGTKEAQANAWEREELRKIKLRYEKLKETIDSWEIKKKEKARRKLQKKEHSDSERKRMKELEKFNSKMQYINHIVGGARAQAEERRRNEELKVKEKANIIRTTGKLPRTCPCF